ncbi:hypothetical protein ES703_15957 [subsurface metagenome]
MRIEFTVTGRPPKKHGEKSMWARSDEAPFVASLRQAAFEARLKARLNTPFHCLVALELRVFIPEPKLESIGDLDSFITGVCDSLQAADPKVLPYLHKVFQEAMAEEAAPKHALLIENDAKVVSIIAKKVAIEKNQKVYYKVAIEPLSQDVTKEE